MKKLIQLFLYIFLLLILIIFYLYYFQFDKKLIENKKNVKNESLIENQNNLIKNLKYEVNFENNSKYLITAELSELVYKEDIEIVKMQKVTASFIDERNIPLIIKSDFANYNNSTYNTQFIDNVLVKYDKNVITSKNLDLSFSENIISIYNNVEYEGLKGSGKTDNVKIDLISKKIDIFMNDKSKKIKLISK